MRPEGKPARERRSVNGANSVQSLVPTAALRARNAFARVRGCLALPIRRSRLCPRAIVRFDATGRPSPRETRAAIKVLTTLPIETGGTVDLVRVGGCFVWAALFTLCVAITEAVSQERRRAGIAVTVGVVRALLAGGLAIAGAIRWHGCFRAANGVEIHFTGGADATGSPNTAICPDRTFGVRDPF